MNSPVTYNPLGITWLQSLLLVAAITAVGLVATVVQRRTRGRMNGDRRFRLWLAWFVAGIIVGFGAAVWLLMEGIAGRIPPLGVVLAFAGALNAQMGVFGMHMQDRRERAQLRDQIERRRSL